MTLPGELFIAFFHSHLVSGDPVSSLVWFQYFLKIPFLVSRSNSFALPNTKIQWNHVKPSFIKIENRLFSPHIVTNCNRRGSYFFFFFLIIVINNAHNGFFNMTQQGSETGKFTNHLYKSRGFTFIDNAGCIVF